MKAACCDPTNISKHDLSQGGSVNYTLEYLKKKHKRVTTAMMMDASGVPREDWEAEMISELPRQMQRHAEKLAEEARRERDQNG
jgi:hypothetical protein